LRFLLVYYCLFHLLYFSPVTLHHLSMSQNSEFLSTEELNNIHLFVVLYTLELFVIPTFDWFLSWLQSMETLALLPGNPYGRFCFAISHYFQSDHLTI